VAKKEHIKGKYKVHPRTGHTGPEVEYRYTCILPSLGTSWQWVVNAMLWSFYAQEGDPVPTVQEFG